MEHEADGLHSVSRQPSVELDETMEAGAMEQAIDEESLGSGAAEAGSASNMPTNQEIDQSIADLEERAEEISRGGNADVETEVDPS